MKELKILKYPHPILKKKAKEIKDPLDSKIQKLIPRMFEAMKAANGVGLAANQIGEAIRLCVIEVEDKKYAIINPEVKLQGKKRLIEEGCLSFPGQFLPIERMEKAKIKYIDGQGKKCKVLAKGLLAIAIQHEIDHLDGILIIDRVKK